MQPESRVRHGRAEWEPTAARPTPTRVSLARSISVRGTAVNVGTNAANEKDARFKTPALFELHRTSPYLHDGRAMTLQEALTTHNPKDLHGKTSGLTAKEIDDLIAYLLAL